MGILDKLNSIQVELKAPKGQKNSFGGYRYRSCESILEAVKPLLKEYGCIINISDDLKLIGNRYYVQATASIKDIETGAEEHTSAYAREEESKKGMDSSQITGSASSYARKYALNGLLAIDDTKDADVYQGGEDKIGSLKIKVLSDAIKRTKTKEDDFLNFYNVPSLGDITNEVYPRCIAALERKEEKMKKGGKK